MSAAPAPAPLPRRPRRWGLLALLAIAVLALLLVAAVAWLVATPGGARLVLDRVAIALGEGAKLSGVEGTFWGTLRIKSIDVKRPDLVVHVEDVEIERAGGVPGFGPVVFRKVHAGSVEVRTASTGAAARMPLTFAAPYPLRVESARVGELRLGTIVKEGKPPPDLVFTDLAVKGEGDERSWKLDEGGAVTPWGAVKLAGSVTTTPPFALDVRGELAGAGDLADLNVSARLGGTLNRVEAAFEAKQGDLAASGSATVQPFEAPPLRALNVRARDVDIARFGNLPHTRLALEATLTPAGSGFKGPVRVTNADPCPSDRERLPIASAEGQLMFVREHGKPRVEVTDARFVLNGGGTAQGGGKWFDGRFDGQWRIADTDLAQVHTRLKPTRLAGTLSAVAERGAQRFEVALADPRFGVEGAATLHDGRLDVEGVRVKHAGGMVDAKGFVVLAQKREFRFEGRAAHFDPAAFVQMPPGELNFTFVTNGTLEPLAAEAQLDIAQSRLGNLPTSGTVRLAGDRSRIAKADVHVAVGESKLDATGAFGRPGDTLQFALRAPDLSVPAKALGIAAGGSVEAQGTLNGTFAAPGGRVNLTAANLSVPGGISAASLVARAEVSAEADGRVDATVEAKGLARRAEGGEQPLRMERASATVQGTRSAHRVQAGATLAKDAQLQATFEGGLEPRAPRPTWRGRITTLALTGGPSDFELVAPATLVIAADRVELGDAALHGEWGDAQFLLTRWTPQVMELRGSSKGLAVRALARALRLPAVPRGGLIVAAEWDVRAAQTVDGSVTISRASGDLRIGDPPQPLGLDDLKVRLEVRRGLAKATASIHGRRIGRVDAEGQATLRHVRAGLGLVPNAPVEARIDAQRDSIAWMAAWMGPEARAEGRARANFVLSGTPEQPRWSGRLDAESINLREPTTGFEVENGVAALALRDRALVIETLSARTPWHPPAQAAKALEGVSHPEAGTLSATGSIDLGARTGAIVVKVYAVPVTQLPVRFLALSGEAKLEARTDGILATGAFTADAGWIGALATALPSVSDDVVVVRASTPAEEPRMRERLRMDVRFGLGNNLWFKGRGLETRLAGDLRITGEAGAGLRGTGAIRTLSGTYDAYGQKLSIERGALTFYGSLENPAINVLALRKGLPVEAGVEVTGTVARPRARLVSVPEVPEPEKISWLVLGRGPGDVSQGEAATLVAAANAILGRNSSGDQIMQRFGFDDVRVGRSDLTSALGVLPQATVAGKTGTSSATEVVSVGKRLSKDLYVVYERGLADAEGALRLTWQITQKFQMLVRAGYLPGVDAVYRWTFE
jgi:translocation and assembly module TamB